jgi:hypothetical protein
MGNRKYGYITLTISTCLTSKTIGKRRDEQSITDHIPNLIACQLTLPVYSRGKAGPCPQTRPPRRPIISPPNPSRLQSPPSLSPLSIPLTHPSIYREGPHRVWLPGKRSASWSGLPGHIGFGCLEKGLHRGWVPQEKVCIVVGSLRSHRVWLPGKRSASWLGLRARASLAPTIDGWVCTAFYRPSSSKSLSGLLRT